VAVVSAAPYDVARLESTRVSLPERHVVGSTVEAVDDGVAVLFEFVEVVLAMIRPMIGLAALRAA
jgi:hypothetical protein